MASTMCIRKSDYYYSKVQGVHIWKWKIPADICYNYPFTAYLLSFSIGCTVLCESP